MLLGIVCLLHCRFWTIIICFFQRWAFCGFFCPCCLGGSREIAHLKLVPQSGPFLPSELQKLMLGSFIAVFLITIAVPAANRVHSIVWKIHCWEWYCWMMKWNYWSNRYGWLCLFFVDGNGYQKNQNLAWPVDHGQGNVEKSRARAFFLSHASPKRPTHSFAVFCSINHQRLILILQRQQCSSGQMATQQTTQSLKHTKQYREQRRRIVRWSFLGSESTQRLPW